ncbi:MAG: UPF0721 transmembrane protein [Candidatus Sericytochromatia bacterium]|nr:MAG: UPF0721 transmembrane protein [Candidatus Sericytochromatia bacterium]
MLILGYFLSLLMGVVLGLIGGGGSILTVPILVYVFGINPVLSTAYSLFIVGITSLFAVIGYLKSNLVNFKVGIIFSIPSFIGVYTARKFLVPIIPDTIINIGSFEIKKNIAILLLFSVMMLLASVSMIKKNNNLSKKELSENKKNLFIFLEGLIVGIITGLVGAGGGFLVIPVLVLLSGLEMKEAVATSLFIITIKSLIGFLGDVENQKLDWNFLMLISIFTIIGSFLGTFLSKKISSEKLKPAFGYFIMIMGIFIFIKESLFIFR